MVLVGGVFVWKHQSVCFAHTQSFFREFFCEFCHVVVGRLVSATRFSFVVCGLGWGGVFVWKHQSVCFAHTQSFFREFFCEFCHVVVGRLVSATRFSFVVCGLGWGGVCEGTFVG